MSKKEIMIRQIKGQFNKKVAEEIQKDQSEMSLRSQNIMKVCSGAVMFVIVLGPLLNLVSFQLNTFVSALSMLIYILFMIFILAPALYCLFALMFITEKKNVD